MSEHPLQTLYPAAWARFQEDETKQSLDFVHYLFAHNYISFEILSHYYLQEPIETTQIEALSKRTASSSPPESRYIVAEKLGQGAMGVVHLAKDKALLRQVAYKALLYDTQEPLPAIVVRRFLNEVQITAQLDHPHIVPIYQLLPSPDGGWGYTMKCIQGQTLKELLQACREAWQAPESLPESLSLNTLLDHFLKVCDALEYAHTKGVIHRDLKPANLMIGPHQEVYVMDWGIARRLQDPELNPPTEQSQPSGSPQDPEATQLGQILGTPRYMSPQQAAGKNAELDGRSDLFALGLILYEMLTLQPAFTAPNQIELLKKVLKAELNPLKAYHPQRPIPNALAAIVSQATQKYPAKRYQRVAEMAQDIRLYLQGEAVSAYAESHWEQILRWIRKHAYTAGLSVLSLITLCLLLMGSSVFYQLKLTQNAQQQQHLLNAVFSSATQRAQRADQIFLSIQSHLEGLISATQQALNHPPLDWETNTGESKTFFLSRDFQHSKTAPHDYQPALAYGREISLNWPGLQIPKTVVAESLNTQIQQIMPLRHRLWQILRAQQAPTESDAQAAQLIRERGSYLTWAYIGLNQGLHLNYPGKGGYAEDYDPRQRPWYQDALQHPGVFWSQPYLDASGQGLLMPCLGAIRGPEDQILGVAGLELSLERLLQNYLFVPEHPEVLNILFLDAQQRLLARSPNRKDAQPEVYTSPQIWQLKGHPLPVGQSSHVQIENKLWVSIFLPSVKGYYVLEVQLP